MPQHLPSSDSAVSVQGVSKRFCRSLKRSLFYGVQDTLWDLTGRSLDTINLRKDEFWANEGVSFEVKAGECVGLIGHNGAGKTTVLKMLNGLIKPDGGSITLRGRIGALIALGAGFNPVLTGRENVFINGAVLGLSRREIASQLDEIINFAEIGEFIDAPVRSYSSGMQVRLGFAVATALKPDILLIDEVLAVGDLDFRMKCISRISQLVGTDTAVVLVSHSMTDIQRVCNRTIVMDQGKVAFDGGVSQGISVYESIGHRKGNAAKIEQPNAKERQVSVASVSALVNGKPGFRQRVYEVQTGDKLALTVTFDCATVVSDARFRIFFESKQYGIAASFSTAKQLGPIELTPGQQTFELNVPSFPFRVGAYQIGASAHFGERGVLMGATAIGEVRVVGPPVPVSAHGDSGWLDVDNEWKIKSGTDNAQAVDLHG